MQVCNGAGCLACEGERQKAIERAEEPIFVADPDDPEDMRLLVEVFGQAALGAAFAPGGGGLEIIRLNAAEAGLRQAARKARKP